MSQHRFSLSYLYTHKCYISIIIFSSFCFHFIYKDNYDGLGSNEQVGTSVHKMLKPVDSF